MKRIIPVLIVIFMTVLFTGCQYSEDGGDNGSVDESPVVGDVTAPVIENIYIDFKRLVIDANEDIQVRIEGWRIIRINDDGTIDNCGGEAFDHEHSPVADDCTQYHIEPTPLPGEFPLFDTGFEYIVVGVVLDTAGNITPVEPIHIIDGVIQ